MKPYVLTAVLNDKFDRFPRMKNLPEAVRDKIADEEYVRRTRGSYNKRNVKCMECFELKSVTGQCSCN